MKKILFGLLMIGVIGVSCKKDNSKTNNPGSKLQKVTFNVGFSKTVTAFQTNSLKINSTTPDTSLTNYIDVLYYMVFDANGNNIHTISQLSTDTAFGHYIDNLQSGTYTVVVAGGKTGLMATTQATPLSSAYIYYAVWQLGTLTSPAQFVLSDFNKDAFVGKTTVTVSTNPASQAFTLNRIVSKIVVNINDNIPAGVTTLQVQATNIADIYMVADGSTAYQNSTVLGYLPGVLTFGGAVPAAYIGQPNYQVTGLLLNNTAQAIDVEISATAGANSVADKIVNGVTFQPNKVTLLSGTLFGGSGGGGLQVTTDTVWNTPVIRTFP